MRFISSIAYSFIALVGATPAPAAEIVADSKIDGVTVYPDAAIVLRVADVDLPAGESALIFRHLPTALDPASLRLEGEGGAKIIIGAV